MGKITVENFNDSLEKNILDRLVQACAKKYEVCDKEGIDSIAFTKCSHYDQAIWDIFREEILEKLSEEELILFFNYENSRYETYSKEEDVHSKNIANASNDIRYNLASAIKKDSDNLCETVDELGGKSR